MNRSGTQREKARVKQIWRGKAKIKTVWSVVTSCERERENKEDGEINHGG